MPEFVRVQLKKDITFDAEKAVSEKAISVKET